MQLAQGVLKWQWFTLNSCKGTSCIIKSYMKLTSSQNYLWEKQSAIKTKMIAIWVNPNATKVKCDCSPPYVVGYLLFGFSKTPHGNSLVCNSFTGRKERSRNAESQVAGWVFPSRSFSNTNEIQCITVIIGNRQIFVPESWHDRLSFWIAYFGGYLM